MKENLKSVIGDIDIWIEEAFIHESNIYLKVGEVLMNRGIDYYQCYDSFYFKKGGMPSDFEDIIAKCAIEYSQKIKSEKELTSSNK